MNMSLAERPTLRAAAAEVLDPLVDDDPMDRVVVTTERAISRVALVAAEAGARFQRDAVAYDAMAWMLSPRRVFDGARPLDACLDRGNCLRGLIVHGLGLGFDVERSAVDALMAHDEDGGDGDESLGDDEAGYARAAAEARAGARPARSRGAARLRLYTATIADTRNNVMMQAFHASMARNVREVRSRLVGRFGTDLADVADIRLGIPKASPVIMALVPAAVIEMIRRTEEDWAAPEARMFGVDIQQCIQF